VAKLSFIVPENGADADFHDLFVENQRRVFGYILTLLPKLEDAKEVFQATSVVIFRKAGQFVRGTDFPKWACQIAHFEVCNYRRKRHKEFLVLDTEVLESIAAKQSASVDNDEDRREALRQCLGKLNEDDRQLIEARYRRNVTSRQLAAEMSRPADNVYKALQRIRRRLQQCIERTMAAEERPV
jgi:RNA polymerase sigma-70 factor, ECF subfamily